MNEFHCFILERISRIKCKWEEKLYEGFQGECQYVENDQWDYTERNDVAAKAISLETKLYLGEMKKNQYHYNFIPEL